MGMTMTQKTLAAHAGLDHVEAGQFIEAKLDAVLANDITGPVAIKNLPAMGADKVAALGVLCGGEPLVTKDKSLLKKHPSAIAEIAGGWFVKTHSGTAAKIRYVKQIAKALKVKLVVTKV